MFQYVFEISRYFSSAFLSHATTEDLKTNFERTVATFLLTKCLQFPTESSYVNQRFYSQFSEHLYDHDNTEPIGIGLCGFLVLHGAFQTENRFVGQKLNDPLRVVCRLYKAVPLYIY